MDHFGELFFELSRHAPQAFRTFCGTLILDP